MMALSIVSEKNKVYTMNIVQIIPGSGGSFYCGNCLRDSKFVTALREEGHQVVKVPMYLPLFADEHDLGDVPVFYGAVSIYLKQLYPIFRKAPEWFDKLLNSKPMLKLAASMAGSTSAKGLEEMTVSMLLGEEGKQKDELERMVDWIGEHLKPDVVHISNALLLGLARKVREKTGVPVVCSLQDEDVWVDVMKPGFRDEVWKLMSRKAEDVDAFIAVSKFYGEEMKNKLSLPEEKIFPVYLGVDPAEYEFIPSVRKPRNIGYISRLCQANGLDIVVDAFILLRQNPAFSDVKLVLTGGYTQEDAKYIKMLKRRIDRAGLHAEVDFHEAFEGQGRTDFFRKVAIGSVPVRNGEAFGMYLPELMASGIPIVQPALGAFPELVELSSGGIVYQPNTPVELMNAWVSLLTDVTRLEEMSIQARKGVETYFNIHDHAQEMIGVYTRLIEDRLTAKNL
jgi:glycosyltransferase involved in cell wall biosynthesis